MLKIILFYYLDDILTEDSLNRNSLLPRKIVEYPSSINIRTKYMTDEEDYTPIESISFSIFTNQQKLESITVLAGFAYENINYVFDIEVCILIKKFKEKKKTRFFVLFCFEYD